MDTMLKKKKGITARERSVGEAGVKRITYQKVQSRTNILKLF